MEIWQWILLGIWVYGVLFVRLDRLILRINPDYRRMLREENERIRARKKLL